MKHFVVGPKLGGRILLFCAIVLSVVIAVGGCGGSGGGSTAPKLINLTRTGVGITVDSPAGAPVPTRVSTALGGADVQNNVAPNVPIYNDGPHFAFATAGSGQIVLMGFVGKDQTVLNARTTAAVLAYFGASVYLLPQDARSRIELLLRTDASIDALEDTVASELARDPASLNNPSPALRASVRSAVSSLLVRSRAILIQNPDDSSGISVLNEGLATIKLKNDFRRRAHYFVERTSYVPAGGGAPVTSNADISNGSISPTVGTTSLIGSITDILIGSDAYVGIETAPIELPIYPAGAQSTTYKVRAVGIGALAGDEADLNADQSAKKRELIRLSFVADLFVPFIANVCMPIKGDSIDTYMNLVHGSDLAAGLVSLIGSTAPAVLTKAESGDVDGALLDLFNSVTTNGQFRLSLLHILWKACAKAGMSEMNLEQFIDGAESALRVLGLVDTLLTAFDTSVQGAHIAASERSHTWTVVSTNSKVRLNPSSAELKPLENKAFTAEVIDAPESAALTYKWTCTASFGGISDGIHTGPSFESSQKTVQYVASVDKAGTDTITVEAFEIKGQDRLSLGKATATVKVGESGEYMIEAFDLDDYASIWHNDNVFHADVDGEYLPGPRGPYTLADAKKGDSVRIQIRDYYGYNAGIGDVYIKRPDGTRKLVITARWFSTPPGNKAVVVDETFTLD